MKLSRRELYELVWSKPVEKVAEDFGISGGGLAKICERHRIPSPPHGYWARLAAGQSVKKAILRDVSDPLFDRVVIESTIAGLSEETQSIIREAKAEEAVRQRESPPVSNLPEVQVAQNIHRSIDLTARLLRKGKADASGTISAVGAGLCGIVIHGDRVERTVSILNALAIALETDGLDLQADGGRMKVIVGADEVAFTLTELIKREAHSPTEKELALYEKQQAQRKRAADRQDWGLHLSLPYGKPWPEFDRVHTGKLVFSIESWARGLRKTWADGKTQAVEAMLEDIVAGIKATLANEKSERERREEDTRIRAKMAHRRDLSKKRKEREEQRTAYLSQLLQRRRQASEVRDWLASLPSDVENEQSGEARRMRIWVQERLADIEAHINLQKAINGPDEKSLFPETDDLHDPLGEPAEPQGDFWQYNT
ncbi:hypothetical protein ACFPL7_12130 [Dongia soli]|uniref:Uncharacterized protein n=1 Tax=Dongia soli TaxID=600628 RepID=A0ABU5EHE5_9PROT|nr:hypothetical protein [Dongia soli]MDY0885439.1 hypothetical protein [Dongia soli]